MENLPELSVKNQILEWLNQDDWDTIPLSEWLQEYHLPSSRYELQPHDWLLRGLALVYEISNAGGLFAERVASLLDKTLETDPLNDCHRETLHNLLLLCAGLQRRRELGPALLRMFHRLMSKPEVILAPELRFALTNALIFNQHDNTLEEAWKTILEGETHKLLFGNQFTATEAMIRMPESTPTLGHPNYDAIGYALGKIAHYFEEKMPQQGEENFRDLLERGRRIYSIPPETWHYKMAEQSYQHDWPDWAEELLPADIAMNVYARLLEDWINDWQFQSPIKLRVETISRIVVRAQEEGKRTQFIKGLAATAMLKLELELKDSQAQQSIREHRGKLFGGRADIHVKREEFSRRRSYNTVAAFVS